MGSVTTFTCDVCGKEMKLNTSTLQFSLGWRNGSSPVIIDDVCSADCARRGLETALWFMRLSDTAPSYPVARKNESEKPK